MITAAIVRVALGNYVNSIYAKGIRLREEHPDWSAARIGRELGVSRERIRQVLAEARMRTGRQPVWCCVVCGVKTAYGIKHCKIHKQRAAIITLVCFQCGILFPRTLNQVKTRARGTQYRTTNVFCSKRCYGVHAGNTAGFAVHRKAWGGRKIKYDAGVARAMWQQGAKTIEIAAAMGCHRHTVERMLKGNRLPNA